MERITFGTNPNSKQEAVFVCFLASFAQPYLNYKEIDKQEREIVIPSVIMAMRYDGKIGFVGGFREDGEALIDTAKREVYEETRNVLNEKLLVPVCSHQDRIVSHLFLYNTTEQDLNIILRNIFISEHFGSEITGGFLVHLNNDEKFMNNFLQHKFAGSCKEELEILSTKFY